MFRRAVVWVALVVGLTGHAAANERAWITGDGVVSFDGDRWIGVGGVRLVQGETEVTADRLLWITSEDQVIFEGNVVVVRGGDQIAGSRLTYDLTRSAGSLSEAVTQFEMSFSKEPIYLLGDPIDFTEGEMTLHDARFTTCEPYAASGYYLYSKRIDIFPGERIVIRNVRFVESGITLFYWPYLSIPLKEGRPIRLSLPEVGHNFSDGWFAKLRFPYDGPGEGYGELELELTQFGGTGAGITHVYRDKPESKGSFGVNGRINTRTDSQRLSLRWDEAFPIDDRLKVALHTFAEAEGGSYGTSRLLLEGAAGIEHRGLSSTTRLDLAGKRDKGLEDRLTSSARLTYSGNLFDWQLNTRVDHFRYLKDGAAEKEALGYLASGARGFRGVSVRLESERRVHSALMSEQGTTKPPWRYLSRPIDATLNLDLQELVDARLPFELGFGFAHLSEELLRGSDYALTKADRRTLSLRTLPGSLPVGEAGRLTYRAGVDLQHYSTGERRMIYSVDHQYRLGLGGGWSAYATYAFRKLAGDQSPFQQFDRVSDAERVSGRLQYLHARGSASVSAGYDLITRRPTDLLGQFTLRPGAHLSAELQTGYSIATGRPTHAAGSIRYRPSDAFSVAASSRYNFAQERVDRVQGSLALAYYGWLFEWGGAYDGVAGELQRSEAALTRDLGCRQISARYDFSRGEVWFEYMITAFPQVPIRVGREDDRLRFDSSPLFNLF